MSVIDMVKMCGLDIKMEEVVVTNMFSARIK